MLFQNRSVTLLFFYRNLNELEAAIEIIDLTLSDDEEEEECPSEYSSEEEYQSEDDKCSKAEECSKDDELQTADDSQTTTCRFKTKIVGIRHYTNTADVGARVVVLREPNNNYGINNINLQSVQWKMIYKKFQMLKFIFKC